MDDRVEVNVQMDAALNDSVAALAAALDRPEAWVIEQALRQFVELQSWQLTAIDAGVKAAEEGRIVPHDAVSAWVQSWDSPGELSRPKCG